ncbi:MAG: hypothetical protein JWR73_1713, partial [Tardiphaga sp.]|nr:hypothetical protein [Tardiphaga sp.]
GAFYDIDGIPSFENTVALAIINNFRARKFRFAPK